VNNRRQTRRQRTCLEGRIVFNHRQSTMDCLIRNLSGDGAKITLPDYAPLPDEFEIAVCRRREAYSAKIVWRNTTEIGLRFLRPTNDNVVSIELKRRIRRLEAERDALATRIADMTYPV
jgi:hypothetical protein